MANRTKRTAIKREAVLAAISAGGTVAEAAQHAGIGRTAIFEWRAADPKFAREFEAAYANGTDRHVAEARKRAFAGSDALLIFLLKARDPAQFNQKMLQVSGDMNNPLVFHRAGAPEDVVHFFMPDNHRHEPEAPEPDAPRTIEGKAEDEEAA